MRNIAPIACPIQRAASLVADVTVIIILRELTGGAKRFDQLLAAGLNPRSLSKRLKSLHTEGIVDRTRFAEFPPRVEYNLTAKGEALIPVLHALQQFGAEWMPLASQTADHNRT